MIVMGFDFGLRFLGIAVGQAITGSASGLATLNCREGQPRWHEVAALIETHRPQQLVVGLPLNMDGSRSEMAEQATAFDLPATGTPDLLSTARM